MKDKERKKRELKCKLEVHVLHLYYIEVHLICSIIIVARVVAGVGRQQIAAGGGCIWFSLDWS